TFSDMNPDTVSNDGPCTIELVARNNKIVSLYRLFRDQVVRSRPDGENFINAYYRHTAELALIINSRPDLKRQCADLITEAVPVITALLRKQDVRLTPVLEVSVNAVIAGLNEHASVGLKQALHKAKMAVAELKSKH
ncbi:MAG: hypothetical protein GY868_01900, partial [Deltaproteobacteria bacterium]|nr:hypothetical protein [Deltaproteobacteria bacterium]